VAARHFSQGMFLEKTLVANRCFSQGLFAKETLGDCKTFFPRNVSLRDASQL
jgi:hypothetical protein